MEVSASSVRRILRRHRIGPIAPPGWADLDAVSSGSLPHRSHSRTSTTFIATIPGYGERRDPNQLRAGRRSSTVAGCYRRTRSNAPRARTSNEVGAGVGGSVVDRVAKGVAIETSSGLSACSHSQQRRDQMPAGRYDPDLLANLPAVMNAV